MAAPILLVADDLAIIAAVKRSLAREGYELVLATNAADAVIAWGHYLPALLILQPTVDGDRGKIIIEELRNHPEGQLLRAIALGESIPGVPLYVEPLPLEHQHFIEALVANARSSADTTGWSVVEKENPTAPNLRPPEGDAWRATGPAVPPPQPPPHRASAEELHTQSAALEERLFGDLPSLEAEMHRDVEAHAMASVESSLPQPSEPDAELEQLEREVREEAARRRAPRMAEAAAPPLNEAMEPGQGGASAHDDETSFADLDSPNSRPTVPRPSMSSMSELVVESLPDRALSVVELLKNQAAISRNARLEEEQHRIAQLNALQNQVAALDRSLADEQTAREMADIVRTRLSGRVRALEEVEQELLKTKSELEQIVAAYKESDEELRTQTDEQAKNLERATGDVAALQALLDEEHETREKLEKEIARLKENSEQSELQQKELTDLKALSEMLEAEMAKLIAERDSLKERASSLETEASDAKNELADVRKTAASAQADVRHLSDRRDELQASVEQTAQELSRVAQEVNALTAERDELAGKHAALQAQLDTVATERDQLKESLSQVREQADALKGRAETAEAGVELAQERIRTLEHRAVMPLAIANKRTIGVARTGTVDLEGLAHIVSQLVLASADVRLELGVHGGTRTLWFKKGHIVGAESSQGHETLIDRARRDGLIDARQETDLRLLRAGSTREQLDAMRARGAIRDIEAIPLAQRYAEFVVLEALSEPQSNYRISDEVPGPEVLVVAVPRVTLPLLAEAIRRALPVDTLLERLGGSGAVPVPEDSELDLRALGFNERERKMLSWVDGEATVEDIVMASGMKQDNAFRALLVAKLLGFLTVRKPEKPTMSVDPGLDVQRLEAKYDEVQDADYFTILGVSRAASTDEVQRAFRRLSDEFDPVKYSGHSDPSLQQRAQVVFGLLEEAAKALEDDRRRAEYARHLVE